MAAEGGGGNIRLDGPCKVHSISVSGAERTKVDFIENEMRTVYDANNLQTLSETLVNSIESLRSLDLFKDVSVTVDVGPEDKADSCIVGVKVQEKPVQSLKAGTFVEGNEGTAEVAVTRRNLFGRGEKLTANSTVGSKSSSSFTVEYNQPRFGKDGASELDLTVHKSIHNNLRYSAHQEGQYGFLAAITREHHTFSYECAWRNIFQVPSGHAMSAIAGHSVKSSIKHTLNMDGRDESYSPANGGQLKCETEYAGIGGDIGFMKHLTRAQLHLPLVGDDAVVLSLGLMAGCILPTNKGKTATISDRFFLGGPLHMRGFRNKGLGPRSQHGASFNNDGAMGGNAVAAVSASLGFGFPGPYLASLGIRGQLFANAGNNATLFPADGTPVKKERVVAFARDARAAVGAGLVWGTRLGRLEVNYCVPMRSFASKGDRTRSGFQIGLGVEWL